MNISNYKAVIFDLDGVLVTTDDCHYLAWKKLADEENIYFDRDINERLRGISRMESLEIVLEKAEKQYSDEEKKEMAERKNSYYVSLVKEIDQSALIDGAIEFISYVKENSLKTAIGSSSKNTNLILSQTGIDSMFDAIADGNIIIKSKPDPEVFLKAAELLGIEPCDCLVCEDADAGVEAAISAGMDVLAVGYAKDNEKATYSADNLKEAFNIIEN